MYYYHLDWANREEYTNYFNNEFIPKHIPDFNKKQTPPWRNHPVDEYWAFFPNQILDIKMLALQDFLKRNFDFPDISYFLIFYQLKDNTLHVDGPEDGSSGVHRTSLNLQLSGYEGTTMNFYEKNPNAIGFLPPGSKTKLWKDDEVKLMDQFKCTNTWTLVNTGIPHNVTVPETGIPKLCLSVRFRGFPAFEDSLAKIKSRTVLI
jgi:hypothetical protein